VTDSGADHGSAIISLLADSPGVAGVQMGALVSLTLKNLRIDPKTRIAKLINFKQKRQGQLIDLAAKLDDLKTKIEGASDLKELNEQAKRIYERQIKMGLTDLRSELRAASIQSTWEGVYRGVFFTVPAQSLLGRRGASASRCSQCCVARHRGGCRCTLDDHGRRSEDVLRSAQGSELLAVYIPA
jgi:TolA-binding protein